MEALMQLEDFNKTFTLDGWAEYYDDGEVLALRLDNVWYEFKENTNDGSMLSSIAVINAPPRAIEIPPITVIGESGQCYARTFERSLCRRHRGVPARHSVYCENLIGIRVTPNVGVTLRR
jgi:hypothetical protein